MSKHRTSTETYEPHCKSFFPIPSSGNGILACPLGYQILA